MAAGMTTPICLVDSTFYVKPQALATLRSLSGPLHVVGIFGPKSTGKSFLLDQLVGQQEGFGSLPGMWMQCWPHPTRSGENFILLDTEGFPEQMDTEKDALFSKFFDVNALLCSTLIYNTKGAEEPQKELEKLSYVRDLPRRGVFSTLPEFVWCLRDVASDSVWEEMLQMTDHSMDTLLDFSAVSEIDTPINTIKSLFPSQKAFCFRNPYVDERDWESFSPHSLHPVFQKQLQAFQEYLLSRDPKWDVSGEVLSNKLELFVGDLSRDEPIAPATFTEAFCKSSLWEDKESVIEPARDTRKTPEEKEPSRNVKRKSKQHGCAGRPREQGPDALWSAAGASGERGAAQCIPSLQEAALVRSGVLGCPSVPLELEVPGCPRQHAVAQAREASPLLRQPSGATTPSSFMDGPVCLIENNPQEKLKLNQHALNLLQSIRQPVVVVAIVGLYRTGKSYLMNRLAGKVEGGFSLGATIEANTKGIWMWCVPHPLKSGHTLVLLDTEGLGDIEKSNTENDSWIFALSILLSSTFIFNSMGTINNFDLEQLHYVAELTNHIKVKSSAPQSEGEDFAFFFPAFVWVVRDFTLQLRLADGSDISEDEYLERALQRRKDIQLNQDTVKKYLRQYFPRRKCFVFERPASTDDLQRLETLDESQLNPKFLDQAHHFCRYIYEQAQPKTIQGIRVVTGEALGSLATTYVKTIRSGAIPCIENAVLALAQIENSGALQDALQRYKDMVALVATLPTENISELLAMHSTCEEEAIQVFLARAFHDEKQVYQKELQAQLQAQLEVLCHRNEEESLSRCVAILMELSQELEENVGSGKYLVPGGYQCFLNDQQEFVNRYLEVPEKGVMAVKALQDFVKSKEKEGECILKADQTLTEKEKAIAAEKAQAEASRQEAARQKQIQEELRCLAKQKDQSFEEHKRQLIKKMEEDTRTILREQERVLDQKLQEQRRLHNEGFHWEVLRLQNEVQNLQSQIRQQQNRDSGSWCVIS